MDLEPPPPGGGPYRIPGEVAPDVELPPAVEIQTGSIEIPGRLLYQDLDELTLIGKPRISSEPGDTPSQLTLLNQLVLVAAIFAVSMTLMVLLRP